MIEIEESEENDDTYEMSDINEGVRTRGRRANRS